ncbi:helix-hairpin-helix domain-containing protein [uncultured Clostridium sp.]|uniref:helix-hairpin-helix domain-containing protein n=1 Tax=uncultured Clostridium sp. TaxID=59620 RepID=UPI002672FA5E|nr:helix-hairpin-helix domain-containing protein [uncultured Clostridium sp.]
MIDLKNKKITGLVIITIIIFIVSIFLYKQKSSNAFKEEYMTEIFEEESNDNMEYTETLEEDTTTINEDSIDRNKIIVEIKGEVAKPDVYQLEEGSIIKDLIDMAGGVTEEADLSRINRAEELLNHELIIIGNINDETESSVVQNNSTYSSNGNNSDKGSTLININTADLEQLKGITGIGNIKAQSIIDYREANGGFKSLEELKNVDGIGDKTFEKIKEQITL